MNPTTSGALTLLAAIGAQSATNIDRYTLRIEPPRVAIAPGSLALDLDGDAPGERRELTRREREHAAAKRKSANAARRRNR